MRTIIELKASQLDDLDRWRKREGISRAEAVRRAVAAHLATQESADARRAFGLWRDRPVDGVRYQDHVRGEWHGRPAVRRGRRS